MTGECHRFEGLAGRSRYLVHVISRNPDGVTSEKFDWAGHANLELVKADLADGDAVAASCAGGVNAVVSLAGPPVKTKGVAHMLPTAIRAVVAGMRAHGVKKLMLSW